MEGVREFPGRFGEIHNQLAPVRPDRVLFADKNPRTCRKCCMESHNPKSAKSAEFRDLAAPVAAIRMVLFGDLIISFLSLVHRLGQLS